jgi:hypothetical protein
MNTLIITLLLFASIIALVFIIALFRKKEHYVKCEIVINAPRQKVFDYIKLLSNQDKFNTHAMTDPNRKEESKGTDGTVGYIYKWSGNKDAGEGEKEIMNIIDGKRIEMEIRFVKPFKAIGYIIMDTESIADNQTKVSLSNEGLLKYPLNIMVPMVEKSVAKGMKISLATLKNILEK